MRKILIILFVFANAIYSQDANDVGLPTIVPPSPTASSLHVYGNTSANYYSGSANVSIPLYEINEGGINLPITLNYNGSNGIRLDEQASLVGLGWTLNTGGAVSRVKRGIADDAEYGFMSYNKLPSVERNNGTVTNIDEIMGIINGRRDGEPDKFQYNLPTVSGSFFINYDRKVHLKPYKNVNIQFTEARIFETGSTNCIPNGNLKTFIIKDKTGITYTLEDKEYSNSKMIGGNFFNKFGYASSWYLSKIENANQTNQINFQYEPYTYRIERLSSNVRGFKGNEEKESYMLDEYIGKRLQKITFSSGSVEFIKTTITRKDIAQEHALEAIIVKDKKGKQIKKYVFEYGYFTKNSFVDFNASIHVSNENRLVLKSIKEVDSFGNKSGEHKFIYNTDHYLPSTYSKAKDHWGYYNGKNYNTTFMARHFFTWYNEQDEEWVTGIYGEANREANSNYGQAGILKKIIYPTKGSTSFEYEGNTAVDSGLPAVVISKNETLSKTYQYNNATTYRDFRISLFSEFVERTEMTISAFNYNPQECFPVVFIKNLGTNEIHQFSFEPRNSSSTGGRPTGPNIGREHTVLLPKGNYRAHYTMNSNTMLCNQNEPAIVSIKWDNESNSETKNVGGVRIKAITNDDGEGNTTIRNFEYLDDSGKTSGSVTNIPRYSYDNYFKNDYGDNITLADPIFGRFRYTNSTLPLIGDQGNTCGYSKVTEKANDGRAGKTDFYFTSSKVFPDVRDGFGENNNEFDHYSFQGRRIETTPIVETNSMSYLRGQLLKKKDYKYNGIVNNQMQYKLVKMEENEYQKHFHYYDKNSPGVDYQENPTKIVEGLKLEYYKKKAFLTAAEGSIFETKVIIQKFKKYVINSGYSILNKTKITSFYDTGNMETVTNYFYPQDSRGVATRFFPVKTETIDSNGDVLVSETVYPQDIQIRTSAEQKLIDQHRIATPIKSNTSIVNSSNEKETISRIYNQYKDWGNDIILPETIKAAKGTATLEDKINYHSYDNKGNPLEVSRENGMFIVYIWGYEQQYPVAKIENATYNQVLRYVADIQTKSNLDVDRTMGYAGTEGALRKALDVLRTKLPNAMITTFTYDPLIGLTSVKDPRGYTMYYEYDAFNRLHKVKDATGNILSANEYNYKND